MEKLITAELFAGIGGFRMACDELGIETVFANDISPKALEVYRSRFSDIVAGDISKLVHEVPPHDILTGGIPCQPFSSAGKKMGIQDPRGTLFQVVIDILKIHEPRYFVIENVKRLLTMDGGSHFATILSALAELDYDIEWRLINAMHFGLAQNRQRIVITGVKRAISSSVCSRLSAPDELQTLSEGQINRLFDRSRWKPIGEHGQKFCFWGLASSGVFFDADIPFISRTRSVKLRDILEPYVSDKFDYTDSMEERIKKSTVVNQFVQGVEILYNQAGGARMGYTIFGSGGIAPTVTCTTSRHYERYKIGDRYRRLTNVEYARLQGFSDDHCSVVSPYDQYALYGNAFPPPMAQWVIGRLTQMVGITRSQIEERGQLELISV